MLGRGPKQKVSVETGVGGAEQVAWRGSHLDTHRQDSGNVRIGKKRIRKCSRALLGLF